MTVLHLGTDLSFALKIWPEPERWIKLIKENLGLNIIEFNSDFLDPLYYKPENYIIIAREIRQICEINNMFIHNYFTGMMTHCVNFLTHPDSRLGESGMTWCKGAIDIASELGAKGLGSHYNNIPFSVRENQRRYNKMVDQLIESIIQLSIYSKEKNLEFLLWEQMYAPSEIPYRINQASDLFKRVNARSLVPIKMTIDLGHSCCHAFKHDENDINPYRWIETFGHMTEVIHLQQTDNTVSAHWPFTNEYNKNGIIYPPKVLESIEKSGAKEIFLIFEIFFPLNYSEERVLSEMQESVDYWRKYL